MKTITLSAAPPSLNGSFKNVPGKGRVKTKQYTAWSKAALWELAAQGYGPSKPPVVTGPYGLVIRVGKSMSRADIDNLIKPIADLLVKAGATPDDRHMCAVLIRKDDGDTVRVSIYDAGEFEHDQP